MSEILVTITGDFSVVLKSQVTIVANQIHKISDKLTIEETQLTIEFYG